MPSTLAHIVYGLDFLELRRPELERGAFLRGVIFPDIRYLGVIDRSKTHYGVALGVVLNEPNSWRTGYLHHNWLDGVWNDFFHHFGLDDVRDAITLQALKLLEDELLYEEIPEREEIAASLAEVDQQALNFGIPPETIVRWGGLIGQAFVSRPSATTRLELLKKLSFDDQTIQSLEDRIAELKTE